MLSYNELKKGITILLNGEPYEILETRHLKKAQRRVVIQTKIKNLISGFSLEKNFHQGDGIEEAEIKKFKAKFLYFHKDRYYFSEKENPAKRFDLTAEQIGLIAKFLKENQIVQGLIFNNKVINIILPIKIQLKVMEAPPGIKGERAQPGTKKVILETGAEVNAPLFVKEGDIIEINTETGEYVKRIE